MRFISPANAYAQHIQAIFERRRSYGMTVHMSRHKEVNGYIFKVKFVDPRVHVVCVCVCVCVYMHLSIIPPPSPARHATYIVHYATSRTQSHTESAHMHAGVSKYKTFS